jgi:serine/threonine protein kinase
MLYKTSPFFKYVEGDEIWHAAALIFGVKALQEVDRKNKIPPKYVKEWGHLQPINLYEDFKDQDLEAREDYPLFEEAFDLLGQLLTLDYKKRPNARDVLQHPFFLNERDNLGV